MQNNDRYFQSLYDQQRLLRAHGFENWPDEIELANYLFTLDDKISVLCDSLGIHLVKDCQGRWVKIDAMNGGSRWMS